MPDPTTPDPEKVFRYSFAYAPPLMIEAAVRLKVFDALADGERSVDDMLQVWLNVVYLDEAEFNRLVAERKARQGGVTSTSQQQQQQQQQQ